MEYVLTTEGLTKQYRNFKALGGLSMHVEKGAIYGFVGRSAGCRHRLPEPTLCMERKIQKGVWPGRDGGWALWWRPRPSMAA